MDRGTNRDDAELVSALKAHSEQDVEEAYDNQIPWTLPRAASEPFVHYSQIKENMLTYAYNWLLLKVLRSYWRILHFQHGKSKLIQHAFTEEPAAAQAGSADPP